LHQKIGQTNYDGAVGSSGFLCEAFDYLKNSMKLSTKDVTTFQKLINAEKSDLFNVLEYVFNSDI
jgi:hypothetical protein